MTKLLFSYGGRYDSGGLRGGQISNKLCGSYDSLILSNQKEKIKNKIIIILKESASDINLLYELKSNNNILILDVIDWLDVDKYNPKFNINAPNFFPKLLKEFYDGYIVNNEKMKIWWYNNMDYDINKPIFPIPHQWNEDYLQIETKFYGDKPYFYYLGYVGHENQNCLHVQTLLNNNLLNDIREGYNYFLNRPTNGCQINIRKEGSWEYCFKPATKLSTSVIMDSIIITTYDWSVQDLLPEDYPYLLKSSEYEEVEKMFQYVKDTYQKEEWITAKRMLSEVKKRLH